jgi:two-component system cell cycle sensor histidine kinase/response regulator CckA
MINRLRILMIEDSEDDAFLVVDDLKRHGFSPTYERVDTPAMLSAALKKQEWDVIISDYSMPSFNGRDALKQVKDTGLDIPFISVSGTLGEERAVEMMRAGAHDYIMKDSLTRLAAAVQREIAAASARREKKRMQKSAAHLAALVESSDDAIISETMEGVIVSWNKAAERIYGYTAEEVIGQHISILAPPNRPNELENTLQRIIMGGESFARVETFRVRKDGTLVEVSVTISAIRDTSGKTIGASTIARDITERRREEAERLRLIQDLTEALAHTKTLQSLLPICASCKKIRDDKGYWQQVEVYFHKHSGMDFTHGLCPECSDRLYPEFSLPPSAA